MSNEHQKTVHDAFVAIAMNLRTVLRPPLSINKLIPEEIQFNPTQTLQFIEDQLYNISLPLDCIEVTKTPVYLMETLLEDVKNYCECIDAACVAVAKIKCGSTLHDGIHTADQKGASIDVPDNKLKTSAVSHDDKYEPVADVLIKTEPTTKSSDTEEHTIDIPIDAAMTYIGTVLHKLLAEPNKEKRLDRMNRIYETIATKNKDGFVKEMQDTLT